MSFPGLSTTRSEYTNGIGSKMRCGQDAHGSDRLVLIQTGHRGFVAFLLERFPEDAVPTVDLVTDALNILQHHPRIGRPREAGLRELVISRGKTGYLALYEYDEVADLVIVLAVRYQREEDYH